MTTVPDRVLRVDLSTRTVTSEVVPERWRRRYLGGKGLGARYLYEELDAGVDPLGPDNALLFMLGPLTGALPGDQRYAAVTKSPLTGAFLDSYAGGEFPAVLAGALGSHLGVIVTGRASTPVSLVVEDETARVEDSDAWGRDAVETARTYPDAAVACIGPAGENQVTFATIASDEATHHAGRGGAGAVMGSKRLKAVVARGTSKQPSPALSALRDRDTDRFVEGDTGRWLDASGTMETVDFAEETGVLASNGWSETGLDDDAEIGIEAARAAATGRERSGRIRGDFRVELDDGETVPRGATGLSLGAGLGITDFEAVASLGEHCNRLGLDLVSAGNAVALAVRLADDGDLDVDVSFGDPECVRELLTAIAARDTGVGDALADGVESAATRFGADHVIPVVKAMSLPALHPRGAASQALAYATSDRGGCHRRARPIEREVFDGPWDPAFAAAFVVDAQNHRAIRWSLVADDFASEHLDVAEWLETAGAPFENVREIGERILNLIRVFNRREGFSREDDALPEAFADDVSRDRFEALLDGYYDERGWADDGAPTDATLERLGLTGK